jgi:hypothetical protein
MVTDMLELMKRSHHGTILSLFPSNGDSNVPLRAQMTIRSSSSACQDPAKVCSKRFNLSFLLFPGLRLFRRRFLLLKMSSEGNLEENGEMNRVKISLDASDQGGVIEQASRPASLRVVSDAAADSPTSSGTIVTVLGNVFEGSSIVQSTALNERNETLAAKDTVEQGPFHPPSGKDALVAAVQAAPRVTLVNRESLRPEGNGPGQGGPPVRTEVANRVKMLLFRQLQGAVGTAYRTEAETFSEPASKERSGCLCRRNHSVHGDTKSTTTMRSSARDANRSPVGSVPIMPFAPETPCSWDDSLLNRVSLCIGHLRAHHGPETLGILGASGSAEAMERLREQVSRYNRLPVDADPHAVAGLLKETLRTTRPALLSIQAYGVFLDMARTSGPGASWDEAINIFRLWQRIRGDLLHPPSRGTLIELLLLLREISQLTAINKMTSRNLALVMAPCLCEWDPLRPNALEQLHVMTDMVQYLVERATLIADIEGHRPLFLERTPPSPGPRSCHSSGEPTAVSSSSPPYCTSIAS